MREPFSETSFGRASERTFFRNVFCVAPSQGKGLGGALSGRASAESLSGAPAGSLGGAAAGAAAGLRRARLRRGLRRRGLRQGTSGRTLPAVKVARDMSRQTPPAVKVACGLSRLATATAPATTPAERLVSFFAHRRSCENVTNHPEGNVTGGDGSLQDCEQLGCRLWPRGGRR